MVDVVRRQPGGLETVRDREAGWPPLVLDACQAFFRDSRDQPAVTDQRGSGIVGVSPDPQYVHVPSATRHHYTEAAAGGHL